LGLYGACVLGGGGGVPQFETCRVEGIIQNECRTRSAGRRAVGDQTSMSRLSRRSVWMSMLYESEKCLGWYGKYSCGGGTELWSVWGGGTKFDAQCPGKTCVLGTLRKTCRRNLLCWDDGKWMLSAGGTCCGEVTMNLQAHARQRSAGTLASECESGLASERDL
jgi:hypothetical protein